MRLSIGEKGLLNAFWGNLALQKAHIGNRLTLRSGQKPSQRGTTESENSIDVVGLQTRGSEFAPEGRCILAILMAIRKGRKIRFSRP